MFPLLEYKHKIFLMRPSSSYFLPNILYSLYRIVVPFERTPSILTPPRNLTSFTLSPIHHEGLLVVIKCSISLFWVTSEFSVLCLSLCFPLRLNTFGSLFTKYHSLRVSPVHFFLFQTFVTIPLNRCRQRDLITLSLV